MEIKLTCRYCNHKFKMSVWTKESLSIRCPICNDKNLRIEEEKEDESGTGGDVFGYNYKPVETKEDELE